jgi:uncharacterized membrane protein
VKRLAAALVVLAAAAFAPAAGAQQPAVRAVLFFSPTCGHCEYVIDEVILPVLFPEHGGEPHWYSGGVEGEDPTFFLATNGTLEILFVDVSSEAGAEMFASAGTVLNIPQPWGVPRLVVGDRYLVGSGDIPDQFPGIIEEGLAAGGIDWPDVPGVAEILAALGGDTTTTSTPDTSTSVPNTTTSIPGTTTTGPATSTTAGTTTTTNGVVPIGNDSPWERFQRDTAANSLALAVLVLMILSLAGVVWLVGRADEQIGPPGLAVPLLGLAGLAVAIYLGFVETSGSEAVCGPVGDCNTVQQSEWARVFGVLPVGLIGVAGYVVVLASWAVARLASERIADWARVALFAGTVAGTAFSIYLTFLEPFVIGATCLWCVSSAVIVTALMWVTARPGMAAWERLRAGD